MLILNETKHFTLVCFTLFIIQAVVGVAFSEPVQFVAIQMFVLLIVYACGIYAINKMNKKIEKVRRAAEQQVEIVEKYEEGEVGKLAQSIENVRKKDEQSYTSIVVMF